MHGAAALFRIQAAFSNASVILLLKVAAEEVEFDCMAIDVFLSALLIILGVGTSLAGLLQVIRSRSVDGLSLATSLMALWTCVYWTSHGITHNEFAQIVNNGVAGAYRVLILAVACRCGVLQASRV